METLITLEHLYINKVETVIIVIIHFFLVHQWYDRILHPTLFLSVCFRLRYTTIKNYSRFHNPQVSFSYLLFYVFSFRYFTFLSLAKSINVWILSSFLWNISSRNKRRLFASFMPCLSFIAASIIHEYDTLVYENPVIELLDTKGVHGPKIMVTTSCYYVHLQST